MPQEGYRRCVLLRLFIFIFLATFAVHDVFSLLIAGIIVHIRMLGFALHSTTSGGGRNNHPLSAASEGMPYTSVSSVKTASGAAHAGIQNLGLKGNTQPAGVTHISSPRRQKQVDL